MFVKNLNNEKGQTALETAIILIAFIVVASVFAFTILSAGNESTEKGKESIQAGLQVVESSMQVNGSVYAVEDGTTAGQVGQLEFNLSLVSGSEPVDLTDTSAGTNVVVIGYQSEDGREPELDWTVAWLGDNDGDALLEEGEKAQITVDLTSLTTPLIENTSFKLEILPKTGGTLTIEGKTPAAIEPFMEIR